MKTNAFKALYGLSEVVFILFVLGGTVLMGIDVYDLIKGKSVIRYSLSETQEKQLIQKDAVQDLSITSTHAGVTDVKVIPQDWKLTFKTSNRGFLIFIRGIRVLSIVYIFMILYFIRKFIHSLMDNAVFTTDKITRLQRIGILFLLIDPLRWVIGFGVDQWIKSYFTALQTTTSISESIGYSLGYSVGSAGIVFHWTFTGLIVLVITQVFKQALSLKEEQELTV